MKNLKQWICAFLVLIILSGVSISRAAEEVTSGECGASLTWVLTDDGVLTISGTGAMTNYKSPQYQRNNIMPWYDNRDQIRTVVIEEGVTSVGEHALYGCVSLQRVVIAEGVTSIGSAAFRACDGLIEVTIPESVKNIGNSAFADCGNLATVTYGGSRVQWNMLAYGHSELVNAGVTCEGNGPVSGTCGVDVTWTLTNDGVLTISGTGAMQNYDSPKYQRNNIMPWYATRSSIRSVVVEEGVTSIGSDAFFECANLQSVVIAEGVTSIGTEAFCGCNALIEVTIPESMKTVGKSAFSGCGNLTTVTYGGSRVQWNMLAYGHSELVNAAVTCNGTGPVSGTCGVDVTWTLTNDGIMTISGTGAMQNYDSPKYQRNNIMPWYATRSSIRSVVVEEGVTSIGSDAFFECANLQSVVLPEGVTSIATEAFCGCNALIEVTIPESVKSIGNSAFSGCGNLATVTYGGSRVQWNMLAYGHNELVNAEVTCEGTGSVSGTCGVDVTWTLTNDGVLTISGTGAMQNYDSPKYQRNNIMPWYATRSSIRNVVVEEGVTSIGSDVFFECANLQSVVLPEGVISIGTEAFCGCNALIEVAIPESVKSIGNSAFSGCGNLATVTYGGSRVQWNMLAYGHSELVNAGVTCEGNGPVSGTCGVDVTWTLTNDGVLTISGTGAMQNYDSPKYQRNNIMPWYATRSSIRSVVVEEGVTSIGSDAFFECANLQSVVIAEGVTSIGTEAFCGCNALIEVTIPESVKNIGNSAFADCGNLATVTYGGSLVQWNMLAYGHAELEKAEATCNGTGSVSGSCGANVTWVLTCDGIMTISGAGTTNDYNKSNKKMPWYPNRSLIISVVVEEGVTSIGEYAFYGCGNLQSLTVADGVTKIGYNAFCGCANLVEVTVPKSLTNISDYAFAECDNLEKAYYNGSLLQWLAIAWNRGNDSLKKAIMLGDVNGDGTVNLGDVQLLFMFTRGKAELTTEGTALADVNGDNTINLGDVQLLFTFTRMK